MKYIRTKDGVYELNNDVYVENNEAFMRWFFDGLELEPDSLGKVIQEADTIEELCDWFFLEGTKGNPINYKKFYTAKRAKERMMIEQELYGVIHIRGKGLIYVAKMNEKGELELL